MRYLLAALLLPACGSEPDPCGDNFGRADDGNCYLLATPDTGGDADTDTDADSDADADADSDADGDADSDTDTDTGKDTGTDTGKDSGTDTGHDSGTDTGHDSGTDTGHDSGVDTGKDTSTTGSGNEIDISGSFTYNDTPAKGAICAVQMWDEADVDGSGHSSGGAAPLDNVDFTCPTTSGVAVTWSGTVDIGSSTGVAFTAVLDPDGDPTTFDAVIGVGSVGTIGVSPGDVVTGIDFVTP